MCDGQLPGLPTFSPAVQESHTRLDRGAPVEIQYIWHKIGDSGGSGNSRGGATPLSIGQVVQIITGLVGFVLL